MNITRVLMTSLCFLIAFGLADSASARSVRLFNADFSLCEIAGKPCEWSVAGAAVVSTTRGVAILSTTAPGIEGYLYQIVYLCTPGVRYRAELSIREILVPGTVVRLGLDPTGGEDLGKIIWVESLAPGIIAVEALALGNNVSVILSVQNGTREGSAALEGVSFAALSTIESLGPQPPMAPPEVRDRAQADLLTAMDFIEKRIRPNDAEDLLSGIVENHPDARPEAARSLVALQRVRHGYQPEMYERPRDEWEDFLGMPYLRETLDRYPEQAEACALARCRMGEHYLGFQIIPQADEFLESVFEDYPETEAYWWARVAKVNLLLWSGDPSSASRVLSEIVAAESEGLALLNQKAWAQYMFYGQRISNNWSVDANEQKVQFYEEFWEAYSDNYLELAVRSKLAKAHLHESLGQYYLALKDYQDLADKIPANSEHMSPPRINQARILLTRGWLPEHKEEGFGLLHEVAQSPMASTRARSAALDDLKTYTISTDGYGTVAWATPAREINLLPNGEFEALPQYWENPKEYAYRHWRFDVKPNWPLCDWHEEAPGSGLGDHTPAWSSVNAGGAIRGRLLHDPIILEGSSPYRAGIWVAADAWDGGFIEDVRYRLSLTFTDGFNMPLGEQTTDTIWVNLEPRKWQEVVLAGETPEYACYAEFILHLDITGEGHHNTAITSATLILGVE